MPSTMDVVENQWLLEFTDVSTSKQSHLLATTNKFVDKDIKITAVAKAGAYAADSSTSSNSEVTPKISNLHATATNTYGFITTLPSGVVATNGTNYLLIDPDATATSWSVTPRAKITTAGWLDTENKTGTAVTGTPSIKAGTSYYIPIVGGGQSDGVTVDGGGFTTKTNTNTVTTAPKVTINTSGTFFSSTSATNYGIVTAIPSGTDGTDFLTIDATGTPTNGTAKSTVVLTRGAITYSNGAGVIAAHDSAATNMGAADSSSITKEVTITPTVTDSFAKRYIPIIKQITLGTTTVSGTTATRGIASWEPGVIAAGTISAATFSNTATTNTTYVDISGTTSAPVLKSGDFLYINRGYVDNLKISLAKLVPDGASASLTGAYILEGYSAYNNAGALGAGSIKTYDGTYT